MSTKAIRELILLTRPWREEAAKKALAEVEAIERAAKGLNQLDPRVGWNQQAWDDGLDLMDSIAKDAP